MHYNYVSCSCLTFSRKKVEIFAQHESTPFKAGLQFAQIKPLNWANSHLA